jgi:hypothetical protein
MRYSTKIITAACATIWLSAALADGSVLGAMQSFQDFCLNSDLSVETIADRAKNRHYKLVVDRRLPGPSGSIIVNNTWHVTDITGDFALTVTQADGLKSGRRFQCGVSLPKGTETKVESALTDPSHFGVPDQTSVNADGSRVVQWLRHFEWGTAAVSLTSNVPSLQGNSVINVLYQTEK